jgi:hypothetical protein
MTQATVASWSDSLLTSSTNGTALERDLVHLQSLDPTAFQLPGQDSNLEKQDQNLL